MSEYELVCGDNLAAMRALPDGYCDLIVTSPPYEAARTYGIDFALKGQDWVDWAVPRFIECCRICKGLVAWVIEGQTKQYRWSATPALFMADLHRAGVKLRKPPIFHRVGIPGSGGPDWLRNDYEFIVCASPGKLPWSDNTAMGHPPKWGPGGEMSNRLGNGARVNQWGKNGGPRGMGNKDADGQVEATPRPSHVTTTIDRDPTTSVFGNQPSEACGREGYKKTYFNGKGHPGNREKKMISARNDDSTRDDEAGESYTDPVLANPGNVIKCIVGGGVMGDDCAHENEAPFPESLPEFFVKSFCPPGGLVGEPHAGSGTTLAVALKHGRRAWGCDVRESQVALTRRRLDAIAPLFTTPESRPA